jgi:hypothetical protein
MEHGAGAGRRRATAWVGHPGTLLAVVVLVINDQMLKQALPGLFTGKLSDVTGLVVAPPLLAVLLEQVTRRSGDRLAAAALALTGVGFAWVKSTSVGADTASWLWSRVLPSRVLADRTDLVALPALALSWWLWTLVRGPDRGSRRVRVARVLVAVPLAVLATVATSSTGGPSRAVGIDSSQGRLVLYVAGDPTWQSYKLWQSSDGGSSWQPVPLPPLSRGTVVPPPPRLPQATLACVPGQPSRCYRTLAGTARVEQTDDGGAHWSTAWQITAGRLLFLHRAQYPYVIRNPYLIGDPGPLLYDVTSLAVVPVADGYRVIVSDDEGGLVVRESDGTWIRQGFPGSEPLLPETGFGQHILVEYAMAFGGACLTLLVSVATMAIPRRARATRVGAPAGRGGRLLSGAGKGVVLVSVALGTGVLTILPFLGWTVARPDSYAVAGSLALAAFLSGLVGGGVLGWRLSPARAPGPEPDSSKD